MGRGPEIAGDLLVRLITDAVDAPVVVGDGERLYEVLAERYGFAEDYVRQCINHLENTGMIYVERLGQIVVAYDVHPAHLRRVSDEWTPTQMLAAMVEAADRNGALTRERYESFPANGRPPSDLIATTFRSWEGAVAAAGLTPMPS
jgi:hypothetical protein